MFLDQYIKMISEGFCDTAEDSTLPSQKKKKIEIENSYLKCHNITIFHQMIPDILQY